MPKAKSKPTPTKTLHVPKKLHREISILAVRRDEDIQDVATRALEAGLLTLKGRAESASAN